MTHVALPAIEIDWLAVVPIEILDANGDVNSVVFRAFAHDENGCLKIQESVLVDIGGRRVYLPTYWFIADREHWVGIVETHGPTVFDDFEKAGVRLAAVTVDR